MKPHKASRTAAMVAATRAWHTKASAQAVFSDPYALLFTPLLWKGVVNFAPLRKYLFESDKTPLRGIAAEVIVRSRYAEDCLWESVGQGTVQYVLVGAGYDSFALRHQHEKRLTVYELDHPATQQRKRHLLARHTADLPEWLHFVPVDFSVTTAGEALEASSYRPQQPGFYQWLGTTPYLSKDETRATLASIANVASSGSELVFDYLMPDSCLGEKDRDSVKQLKEYTKRSAEPILGAFNPDEMSQLVSELGYDVVENLSAADLEQRYLQQHPDKLQIFGAAACMRCKVKSV